MKTAVLSARSLPEDAAMPRTANPRQTASMPEANFPTASALLEQMHSGAVDAVTVVEQHIERIQRSHPALNALTQDRFALARGEAREADRKRRAGEPLGRLHGLPITVKEAIDVHGMASTFGLSSRAGHRAQADEAHIARLRAEGAIVLGKTNVAQMLFYYESENPLYGRTNHPMDATRSPGGSSGGEAALVATGASALGIGTDIGGSVRIPAHFCGIVGFKPSAGRCPDPGRFSVPFGQQAIRSQIGVLARSVGDAALSLSVLDRTVDPYAVRPLGDHRAVDIKGLRIGWYDDDGTFAVSPAIQRAVREAADILRHAGAVLVPLTPPRADHALDLVYGIFGGDGIATMGKMLKGEKKAPQIAQLAAGGALPRWAVRALMALLHTMGQHGMADGMRAFGYRDTAHYWGLVEALEDYRGMFHRAMDDAAPGGGIDAILAPPCALPAFRHGDSVKLITAGAYACLYNALGLPAGVVPVTRVRADETRGRPATRDAVFKLAAAVDEGSAGLPVGVQVASRTGHDEVALAVMQAIESGVSPLRG